MTTTVHARPKDEITHDLLEHLRTFERAQAAVKQRIGDIRNGTIPSHRIPTMSLVEQRDQTRKSLQQFFEELTEDEQTMLAIMWGNHNWREEYDDYLDPKHDPAV